MRLIFAVDAIFAPLTGVGRYAWELAARLAQSHGAGDIKYFSHGRFVANPTLAGDAASTGLPPMGARVRARLASSRTAVKLYSNITPMIYRWQLRDFADYLFHSPNYFLPPFEGPCIATVHDLSTLLYPEFHPAARVAFMETELPKTLSRAAHLITDSKFIRNQVIEQFGWPASKISAISLGADARFHPRDQVETQTLLNQYGLSHGSYTLCVATIEPRKNIERLVRAHQALPEPLRLLHPLVLVGDVGWNSEALHQQIRQLQGPSLRYFNYVPQEHLYILYAGARLFAFPSIYEGYGLPVLEAKASGVPVLISNSPSLAEAGGSSGWQVNPLDIDAIRSGLIHCLQHDAWRAQAVDTGVRAAAELTWARCFEQTRELCCRFQPLSNGAS